MRLSIDSTKLQKTLVYGGLIFLFSLLQITLLPRYPIFGVTPDLSLSCVLAVAMFEGRKGGGIAGIATGFYIDAVGSLGLSLLPLFYFIAGFVVGICAEFLFRRGFESWSMAVFGGYFLRSFITLICLSVSYSHYSFWEVFATLMIPEFTASVLFSYPLFVIFRLAAKRFHKNYELRS